MAPAPPCGKMSPMPLATPDPSSAEHTAAPLLQVTDLRVSFRSPYGDVPAVQGASFTLRQGQTLAIVGESGSGKSTTAMAVIGLLPDNGQVVGGSITFDGRELTPSAEKAYRGVRGRQMGLIPQDPLSSLNPVARIGDQIAETLLINEVATKADVAAQVIDVMTRAGIPDPAAKVRAYPHELSGGLRQRVLIAIGLACRPRLLIADEPTSALDVTVQRAILDQIETMTTELGTSVLLITHDLALAAERADEVVVMYRGRIVEQGPARQILEHPQHPYTRSLVAAAPSVQVARLGAGPNAGAGAEGADDAAAVPATPAPPDALVHLRGLTKVYPARGGKDFVAAQDVSLTIPRGSTVAIVGESGSGKTTTARMLLGLIEPTAGSILFDGKELGSLSAAERKDFRRRVQPIFQDPYSSLNPLFTLERIIREPLDASRVGTMASRRARVRELMDQVALPQTLLRRRPAELSGGQRQRVAIARALALEPELIVCDEPVSALDVLVQEQILTLLDQLQAERGLSYLFISHDLAVVRRLADTVCVMQKGKVVEAAASEDVFTNPRHPYTRRLLASIPGNALGIEAA